MRGLYAILDVPLCRARGLEPEAVLEALLEGGASVVQLRWKGAAAGPLVDLGRRAKARCEERGVLFVMNDRVDAAGLVGAGGVHLGQQDLPVEVARAQLPEGTLIGVSTHTPEELAAALDDGADYVGFGPVYGTRTKERPDPVVGLEALAAAVRRAGRTPVVAIGGITLERAPAVAATGCAALAVVSDLLAGGDVVERARALARAAEVSR